MRRLLKFNYVIGAGAMGTVYHAELRVPSGGFTRQCAVKGMKAFGPDLNTSAPECETKHGSSECYKMSRYSVSRSS